MRKEPTPAHISAQKEIDIERTAWKILGNIILFDGAWNLSSLQMRLSIGDIFLDSIRWLKENGLISVSNGFLYRTTDGMIAYEEISHSPGHFQTGSSTMEFNHEVRSGMDRRGNQTKIENAVIPSTGRVHGHKNKVENETISILERVDPARVAADLGIGVESLREGLNDGSIHTCMNVEPHLGQFHKSNNRGGWQSKCIACRKRER